MKMGETSDRLPKYAPADGLDWHRFSSRTLEIASIELKADVERMTSPRPETGTN